jgi:hypothetical protein
MNRTLVVGLALVCSASAAAAQIPDQFKNLQVLPKDIAKKDLVDKMRGFCTSLGVRCTHCHVGEEGKPLETYDFAADTKAPKQTARVMLQMVQAVNHDWVSKVVSDRQERMQVSCVTCHHGQPVPRTLQATLTGTLAANGLPATVQKYRDLREQYYGRDTFDFGEMSLNNMARGLLRDNRTADALDSGAQSRVLPEVSDGAGFDGRSPDASRRQGKGRGSVSAGSSRSKERDGHEAPQRARREVKGSSTRDAARRGVSSMTQAGRSMKIWSGEYSGHHRAPLRICDRGR